MRYLGHCLLRCSLRCLWLGGWHFYALPAISAVSGVLRASSSLTPAGNQWRTVRFNRPIHEFSSRSADLSKWEQTTWRVWEPRLGMESGLKYHKNLENIHETLFLLINVAFTTSVGARLNNGVLLNRPHILFNDCRIIEWKCTGISLSCYHTCHSKSLLTSSLCFCTIFRTWSNSSSILDCVVSSSALESDKALFIGKNSFFSWDNWKTKFKGN